jgi:hypothetical protein
MSSAVDAFLGALVADATPACPCMEITTSVRGLRDYPEFAAGDPAAFVLLAEPACRQHPLAIELHAAQREGEILHDQARYWGQCGVHYHQFLQPGENTLNFQLAIELAALVRRAGGYDPRPGSIATWRSITPGSASRHLRRGVSPAFLHEPGFGPQTDQLWRCSRRADRRPRARAGARGRGPTHPHLRPHRALDA